MYSNKLPHIEWNSEKDFLEKYRILMYNFINGEQSAYNQIKDLRVKVFRNTIDIVNNGEYRTENGKRYIFADDSDMMR